MRVTVVAEVARNYLELRGAQARRVVADANLASARETFRLTSVRSRVGYQDPVDVESARARVSATEALIPPLRRAGEAAPPSASPYSWGNGRAPSTPSWRRRRAEPPAHASQLAVGDVSELLRRRPDVRAAERRLAAETARTGVAAPPTCSRACG